MVKSTAMATAATHIPVRRELRHIFRQAIVTSIVKPPVLVRACFIMPPAHSKRRLSATGFPIARLTGRNAIIEERTVAPMPVPIITSGLQVDL